MTKPVRNPDELPPLPESVALRAAIDCGDMSIDATMRYLDALDARVAELQREAKAYRDLVWLAAGEVPGGVMVWAPSGSGEDWAVCPMGCDDESHGPDLAAALAAAADRGRA